MGSDVGNVVKFNKKFGTVSCLYSVLMNLVKKLEINEVLCDPKNISIFYFLL